MLCGLDQLFSAPGAALRRRLRAARVGLLTHSAAVDRRGRNTLAVLDELGASPALVFTPEHGLYGFAQAEEAVPSEGPKQISLYGQDKDSLAPKAEQLAEIDVLLIDLCDVGSRYYTYVWTALQAARAAAQANVHTVVLDRPNPISGDPATLEGKPQDPEYLSFVGLEPLPIRHALSIAEIVAHFMEQAGHGLGMGGALSVVKTRGWERFRPADAWGRPFVPPSPNMPTLETALVYPGACLLEGTNLSEGRGTTTPFQLVGAPFLDGERLARELVERTPGTLVRPCQFRPTFDKHAGEICHGVMIHVTNPTWFKPVASYLSLIALARAQAPEQFEFLSRVYEFESERPAFDLLTGSSRVRTAMLDGATSPEALGELLCPVDASWRDFVRQAEARLDRAEA